mgnify:CR=1 FL=1
MSFGAGRVLRTGIKFGLALIFFMGVLFPAAMAKAGERFEAAASYFGTTVNIAVCYPAGDREQVLAAAGRVWEEFALMHSRMNKFDPASDLSRLNQNSGQEISVDAQIYAL